MARQPGSQSPAAAVEGSLAGSGIRPPAAAGDAAVGTAAAGPRVLHLSAGCPRHVRNSCRFFLRSGACVSMSRAVYETPSAVGDAKRARHRRGTPGREDWENGNTHTPPSDDDGHGPRPEGRRPCRTTRRARRGRVPRHRERRPQKVRPPRRRPRAAPCPGAADVPEARTTPLPSYGTSVRVVAKPNGLTTDSKDATATFRASSRPSGAASPRQQR